ncbi:5'-methylthioadenosine/S-adenosylhomocysteine nucleosidase [Alicyclobacillaceae bacterium I2511]|nr:5'-methylthioadenosine/S-adenosylhomocysteine nucleosidase [Alicyclobacillaceae bacterium I2511]
MKEEMDLLRDHICAVEQPAIAGVSFFRGQFANSEVILLQSGIGKVNAALATTLLHQVYAPDVVINTGSAGGLQSKFKVGDIVLATTIQYHDVNVTTFGYQLGQVPGEPVSYHVDNFLFAQALDAAQKMTPSVHQGLLLSGDQFMDDPVKIAYLQEHWPQAVAVEMEGAAIAQVCHHFGTKFLAIRALSDIAGQESQRSFTEFLKEAAENSSNLVLQTISTPD